MLSDFLTHVMEIIHLFLYILLLFWKKVVDSLDYLLDRDRRDNRDRDDYRDDYRERVERDHRDREEYREHRDRERGRERDRDRDRQERGRDQEREKPRKSYFEKPLEEVCGSFNLNTIFIFYIAINLMRNL